METKNSAEVLQANNFAKLPLLRLLDNEMPTAGTLETFSVENFYHSNENSDAFVHFLQQEHELNSLLKRPARVVYHFKPNDQSELEPINGKYISIEPNLVSISSHGAFLLLATKHKETLHKAIEVAATAPEQLADLQRSRLELAFAYAAQCEWQRLPVLNGENVSAGIVRLHALVEQPEIPAQTKTNSLLQPIRQLVIKPAGFASFCQNRITSLGDTPLAVTVTNTGLKLQMTAKADVSLTLLPANELSVFLEFIVECNTRSFYNGSGRANDVVRAILETIAAFGEVPDQAELLQSSFSRLANAGFDTSLHASLLSLIHNNPLPKRNGELQSRSHNLDHMLGKTIPVSQALGVAPEFFDPLVSLPVAIALRTGSLGAVREHFSKLQRTDYESDQKISLQSEINSLSLSIRQELMPAGINEKINALKALQKEIRSHERDRARQERVIQAHADIPVRLVALRERLTQLANECATKLVGLGVTDAGIPARIVALTAEQVQNKKERDELAAKLVDAWMKAARKRAARFTSALNLMTEIKKKESDEALNAPQSESETKDAARLEKQKIALDKMLLRLAKKNQTVPDAAELLARKNLLLEKMSKRKEFLQPDKTELTRKRDEGKKIASTIRVLKNIIPQLTKRQDAIKKLIADLEQQHSHFSMPPKMPDRSAELALTVQNIERQEGKVRAVKKKIRATFLERSAPLRMAVEDRSERSKFKESLNNIKGTSEYDVDRSPLGLAFTTRFDREARLSGECGTIRFFVAGLIGSRHFSSPYLNSFRNLRETERIELRDWINNKVITGTDDCFSLLSYPSLVTLVGELHTHLKTLPLIEEAENLLIERAGLYVYQASGDQLDAVKKTVVRSQVDALWLMLVQKTLPAEQRIQAERICINYFQRERVVESNPKLATDLLGLLRIPNDIQDVAAQNHLSMLTRLLMTATDREILAKTSDWLLSYVAVAGDAGQELLSQVWKTIESRHLGADFVVKLCRAAPKSGSADSVKTKKFMQILDLISKATITNGLLNLIENDPASFDQDVFGAQTTIAERLLKLISLDILAHHLAPKGAQEIADLTGHLPPNMFGQLASTHDLSRPILYRHAYENADRGDEEIESLITGNMMRNHYYFLGVPRTANNDDLKKNYRALGWCFHPDRLRFESVSVQQSAKDLFNFINKAYEVLEDADKRREYNKHLPNEIQSYPTYSWLKNVANSDSSPWDEPEEVIK